MARSFYQPTARAPVDGPMSVRPQEAAESASRFSLRSVFGSATPTPTPHDSPPTSGDTSFALPPHVQVHPHAQVQRSAHEPLRMSDEWARRGATHAPAAVGVVGGGGGFKFTLPQMRGPAAPGVRPTAPGTGSNIARSLQAGFVSGGAAQTTQETLRLNGVIADLQSKLDSSAERLASAERSIARGNKALATERATYNARLTALSAELKSAKEREVVARTELASVPRMEAFDMERFKMQAEGAVELQARYDEALARTTELEALVAETTEAHEAMKLQHAALEEALVVAQLAVGAEQQERAEATQNDAVEAAEAAEAVEAAESIAVAAATAQNDAVLAAEAAEAAEAGEAVEPPADAIAALRLAVEEHLKTIESLKTDCAEADTIIKSNDLKIAALCEERDAAKAETAEAIASRDRVLSEAETLPEAELSEMERVTEAVQAASAAAERISKAGVNATPAMHADLGRKRMMANRLRRAAETGDAPRALVTVARFAEAATEAAGAGAGAGADRSEAKLHAARLALATGMNASAGFGTSAPALADSEGFDLHTITAARCHELLDEPPAEEDVATDAAADGTDALVRTQLAEAVSQQMRVNDLVKAISTDLKWELAQVAEAFKQRPVVAQ